MRKRALALIVVLALGGCASTDNDTDSENADGSATADAEAGADAGASATAPVQLEGEVELEGSADISTGGAKPSVTITLADNSFNPTFVKAAPGSTVSVALKNEGERTHTFTIEALNVDEELTPGGTGDVDVTLPSDGVVRFACKFHGQGGMQGAFYFTEGEAASGSGDTDGNPTVPNDY